MVVQQIFLQREYTVQDNKLARFYLFFSSPKVDCEYKEKSLPRYSDTY